METKMQNVVTLIGRLGEKPVCRTFSDRSRVANLSIATNDGYKASDGKWVERTTWHRVTVFGDKRVDYIEQHYSKGDLIQFTGRLSYKQSEREGTKYHNVELIGSTAMLAHPYKEAGHEPAEELSEPAPKPRRRKASEPRYDLDDEIPF